MCCSWRWVGAAPNPKDFGLLLAQEVRMIQPKTERNSHLQEVEVFQVQHPLFLLEKGEYSLCNLPDLWKISNNLDIHWAFIFICATIQTCYSYSGPCLLPFCSVTFVIMLTALPFHTLLLYWFKTLWLICGLWLLIIVIFCDVQNILISTCLHFLFSSF